MMNENEVFKKIDVTTKIDAKENSIVATNATFYSYDTNTSLIKMKLVKEGQPMSLPVGTEVLLTAVKINKDKNKLVFSPQIKDRTQGLIEWIIPQQLRGYVGSLRIGVFIKLPNNQRLHGGYFSVSMDVSDIDSDNGWTEIYWQSWDDFQSQAEAEWENWKSQQITKQSKFESDTNVYLNGIETKVDAAQADLTQLKQEMHLSEAWSNSPDGTVDFSRTKPRSTATPWTSAPSDSTLENEFSKYYGLALTDSNDPSDYVWIESPEYTRYKAKLDAEYSQIAWISGQEIVRKHLIDFKGKVSGSTVENVNIMQVANLAEFANPTLNYYEYSQSHYNSIAKLDGVIFTDGTTVNTARHQKIFKWNLAEQINRDYPGLFASIGADTLAKQVAFIKANITQLKPSVWGYGASANGNRLTIKAWDSINSQWGTTTVSNYTNQVQQVSYVWNASASIATLISNNGFMYVLAYAEPSNGTITSSVIIDYASLEYTLSFKKSDFDTVTKNELGEIKEWIAAHS